MLNKFKLFPKKVFLNLATWIKKKHDNLNNHILKYMAYPFSSNFFTGMLLFTQRTLYYKVMWCISVPI